MGSLSLQHVVELLLFVVALLVIIPSLFSAGCSMLEPSETSLESIWSYYEEPSSTDGVTVELGQGEAIVGYGEDGFRYRSEEFNDVDERSQFQHLNGLYSPRPDRVACKDSPTCICHCGSINVTTMDPVDALTHVETTYQGERRPPEQGFKETQFQCLQPTCKQSQHRIKQDMPASNVLGEASGDYQPRYDAQGYDESFIILNDLNAIKPARTSTDGLPYTFAGYTQQTGTASQTVIITETDDGSRKLCIGPHCSTDEE